MEEIWKPVVGYEWLYEVSNLGNIMSLGTGLRNSKRRVLSLRVDKDGYHDISLSKNNLPKRYKVHRLVAQSFIENINNYPVINHINGIKRDNSVDNLDWCTIAHNNNEAFRIGLKIGPRKGIFGKDNPSSIPIIQLSNNGEFIKEWGSIKDASRLLNIDNSGIGKCCKGVYKIAGGFKWEYKNKIT